MTEPLKLAAKLAAARVKLGSLQPDKVNKEQNYKYISADKILERGGDVLAELGVVVIPSVIEVTLTQSERQGKSPRLDALLKMSFLVTDGETENVAYWTGCGSDYVTPDKAIYKAITSGHKYFLMKLLNVGVGNEDGEHENGEQEVTRQTTQAARQYQAQTVSKPIDEAVKTTSPKPAPIEAVSSASTPPGNISPKMLVDNGISKDIPRAAETINKLSVGGKPAAEYWGRVILYRKWRDAGYDSSTAAIAAVAGEQLPE